MQILLMGSPAPSDFRVKKINYQQELIYDGGYPGFISGDTPVAVEFKIMITPQADRGGTTQEPDEAYRSIMYSKYVRPVLSNRKVNDEYTYVLNADFDIEFDVNQGEFIWMPYSAQLPEIPGGQPSSFYAAVGEPR